MKLASLAFVILVAVSAEAQEKRVLIRAGGPAGDATKDWPKITTKAATEAAITPALAAYLADLTGRDLFSGTVLVAKNGKPLFFHSYGAGNDNHTKYNLGSINKLFTTVAMKQLRDLGRIDFNKTLRTYLPDYPSPIADRITIRQILDHKSGLGDFFGPQYMSADKQKIRKLSDYLPFFVDKPLEFEPGARNRYSNAGYIVLGLVIEQITGMSYYDYVRQNIFVPAGMASTDSYPSDAKIANRAIGMTKRGREGPLPERRANTASLPGRGSSAGGGYSTAMDLLRFADFLRKMKGMTPGGWAGGAPGVNAAFEVDDPWTIIVLGNYDPPAAEEVAMNIGRLLGQNRGE